MSRPKEKRLKTADHRWGPGKVHRLVYNRENRIWYTVCKSSTLGKPYGDETIDPDTPVTCKRCQ